MSNSVGLDEANHHVVTHLSEKPRGKKFQGPLGDESSPQVTARKIQVPQSHNHKQLNFSNNHISLEEVSKLQKVTQPSQYCRIISIYSLNIFDYIQHSLLIINLTS